jgi:hypothetical protein
VSVCKGARESFLKWRCSTINTRLIWYAGYKLLIMSFRGSNTPQKCVHRQKDLNNSFQWRKILLTSWKCFRGCTYGTKVPHHYWMRRVSFDLVHVAAMLPMWRSLLLREETLFMVLFSLHFGESDSNHYYMRHQRGLKQRVSPTRWAARRERPGSTPA